MEEVHNLINICPTNPFQVLNLLGFFFEDFVYVHQMVLLTKIFKKEMLVLGGHNKDRKFTGDKTNIGNPKVNRGCPQVTANRTSADCGKFTWTFGVIYSTGGLPYWEFQCYACCTMKHNSSSHWNPGTTKYVAYISQQMIVPIHSTSDLSIVSLELSL